MPSRAQALPKVLVITHEDVGGLAHALAIECQRRAIADLRIFSLDATARWGFPVDIHELRDGGVELETLLHDADVLHFRDVDPVALGLEGLLAARQQQGRTRPRVVVQLDGRMAWDQSLAIAQSSHAAGLTVVATRPHLARETSATFVLPFVPWWQPRYSPLLADTRTRESLQRPVVICVSSRMPIEQRPALEELLDQAEQELRQRVVLEVLVNMPYRTVLRRRRFAHLFLSESRDGLALSALEALCQGLRVVTHLEAAHAAAYTTIAGAAPPLIAPSQLSAVLEALSPRTPALHEGVDWARKALDPSRWLLTMQAIWNGEQQLAA